MCIRDSPYLDQSDGTLWINRLIHFKQRMMPASTTPDLTDTCDQAAA